MLRLYMHAEWRVKAAVRVHSAARERNARKAQLVVTVVMRPVAVKVGANAPCDQRNDGELRYVQSFNH